MSLGFEISTLQVEMIFDGDYSLVNFWWPFSFSKSVLVAL